ncbi:MAG: HAMP domain-containing protein [Janthinobacterium lividum]
MSPKPTTTKPWTCSTATPAWGPLVVVASSVDEDSRQQLNERRRLAAGLLAALAVTGVGGWGLAGQALRPLRRVVREVDGITATDLGQRLTQAEGRADEIGRLAQRFNRLLDRLEAAFAGQRSFVRDASPELRTPPTALIGELEVALLQAERPPRPSTAACCNTPWTRPGASTN